MVACGTISRGCSADDNGSDVGVGAAGGVTSVTGVVDNGVVAIGGGGGLGSTAAGLGVGAAAGRGAGVLGGVKSTGAGAAGAGAIAAAGSGAAGIAVANFGADVAVVGAPSACGVGTLSVAPERRVLGFPLLKAVGLPAIRIAIICGTLIAVEGRTRLAIAASVSPALTGP